KSQDDLTAEKEKHNETENQLKVTNQANKDLTKAKTDLEKQLADKEEKKKLQDNLKKANLIRQKKIQKYQRVLGNKKTELEKKINGLEKANADLAENREATAEEIKILEYLLQLAEQNRGKDQDKVKELKDQLSELKTALNERPTAE
ncbi:8453_t:CDS:2, partial [Cetraspora pellucida]